MMWIGRSSIVPTGLVLVALLFGSNNCDDAVIIKTTASTAATTTTVHENPSKQNICSKCKCSPVEREPEYQQVVCIHRELVQIPRARDLPDRTLVLDLSNNNITVVDKFEKLDTLNHLSLSTNGITKIKPLAFEQLQQMANLDLSFNELEKIPTTLFETLIELQRLDLSNNRIRYLETDLFKHNTLLTELNLANNHIDYISPDTFLYVHELNYLSLAQNPMYSLPGGLFASVNKIESLDLSGCEYQEVPINALRKIKHLRILDLSNNPIAVLDRNSFDGLNSLIELKLDHMPKLIKVKRNTFSKMLELEKLHLSNNQHLSMINENAFAGMFNHEHIKIKFVDLRKNQLRKLSEHTLPFCNLSYLDLRGNPWDCNCHVHWIKYCHGPKEFESDILCGMPEHWVGQELVEMDDKNLVCHGRFHEGSHRLLLVSMFFMTGVFVSIALLIFRNQITAYYGSRKKEGSIYYVRAQSQSGEP